MFGTAIATDLAALFKSWRTNKQRHHVVRHSRGPVVYFSLSKFVIEDEDELEAKDRTGAKKIISTTGCNNDSNLA